MNDRLFEDDRLATAIMLLVTLLLCISAALGLNPWPGQELIGAFVSGKAKTIFLALVGYGLIFSAIFWATRPTPSAQWLAMTGWVACAILSWTYFGDELGIDWFSYKGLPVVMFLGGALGIPCLVLLGLRASGRFFCGESAAYEARLRRLLGLTLLFMVVPPAVLSLTGSLHPHTLDIFALRFDHAAGLNVAPALIDWVNSIPGFSHLIRNAYGLTPLGFLAVAVLHMNGRPVHVASALLVWVGMTTCAALAYHAFPITGPQYVFGTAEFAAKLRNPEQFGISLALVAPYPRNGMPSMHFGWMLAASILWWQSGTRALSRSVIIGATLCTALATIYNGEHYVIDLIVATPFVLGSIALCTTGIPWHVPARQQVVLAGFGTWLVWIVALRTQMDVFVAYPWAAKLLVALTLLVVVRQAQLLSRFKAIAASVPSCMPMVRATSPQLRKFGLLFFVSGAAALVYQVLFAKELALVFGSTATATFTVLATFLGGMAIGSFFGGIVAHKTVRPIIVYALIELAIAIYCSITPSLFQLIQSIYVELASGIAADAPRLLALRVMLGATVLLVPTMLMGATLPLLATALGRRDGSLGTRVAWLYFANTAGAATGALMTAYFIIPAVGVRSTTLVAAMLNLLIALAAFQIAKSAVADTPASHAAYGEAPAAEKLPVRTFIAALIALGMGGILSLGLEVVYVHLLSIVAGNSVYAFGLMVATFLVGLSLGGEAGRRLLLSRSIDPASALSLALLCLATCIALGASMWNGIPDYFGRYAGYPAATTFAAREAIRGLICGLVMIPPTLFIGMAYTLAMDLVTSGNAWPKPILLGLGGAVNTLGNIVGVLLFGFLLLPLVGGLGAIRIIAYAALFLAGVVIVLAARMSFRKGGAAFGVAGLLLLSQNGIELNYESLSSGANVYFYPQSWGKVVDHAESIDGGLTSVTYGAGGQGGIHTLLTNGKFQGNDAMEGEMQAQIGFATAPLLHTEKRERALVIGYGTGVTSRVFHEAGFRRLEIAELSADVMTMADRYFGKVNGQVSTQPGVTLHVTDGRNLLLLSERQFDVISMEISSIWFAGAASLYNREFYQLAKRRMTEWGILQQWVQLHRLSPMDILSVIASIRTEFRYVTLYVIGSQGILVATNDASRKLPNRLAIDALERQAGLAEVRRIAGRDFSAVADELVLGPDDVDRYLDKYAGNPEWHASTDNNLRLEYSTPKGNVNDATKSFELNVELLKAFATRTQ